MRTSTISALLAGACLALGACAISAAPGTLTSAELAELCRSPNGVAAPTGRHTGDVRQDYRCTSPHARATRETRAGGAEGQLSAAVDRSLRRGY